MTLLLKLVLAPLLVVGSSLAGRKWGDRVAGTLVAFPIVAGPILLIASMEQGARFGARAASASLLGLASLAVFAVAFASASRRWGWLPSVAVSWAATLVADVLVTRRVVAPGWGLAIALTAMWLAYRFVKRRDAGAPHAPPVATPWWDLPGRAVVTAALVLTVTGVSALVGPVVTGILAPFPIATTVVAGFALAQQGWSAAVRTVVGLTRGLFGFAVFCFLLAVLLVPWGIAGAFAAAMVGTFVVQVFGIAGASWRGERRSGQDVQAAYQLRSRGDAQFGEDAVQVGSHGAG